MVPLNISFKAPAVEYILNNSEARVIITSKKFLPLIKECSLDFLENIILVDGDKSDDYILLSDLKDQKITLPQLENIDQESTAACLYTSGTTGQPKGAMLTHHNLIFDTQKSIEHLKVDDSDRYICVLPMFHAFAETVCMLMPMFLGAEIVIVDRFLPEKVLKTIQEKNVTFFAGVPTMYSALLNVKNKDEYDLSNLNLCISGGAAMPQQTMEDFEKTFNVKILEGNGPTETSPVAYVNPVEGEKKSGSVGLPIPETEAKIVDEEDNELPRGEIGEITVRGEHVMKGYFKMPEATAETLRNGWLHTGDLGKMDQDGYVYIVDRKKDMINVGGMNVYPREIEEQLYKHPKIREAAVVATKDELRGEIPKAVIVLQDGESSTEREIQKYCMKYFANYKIPKLVDFSDELPKNATGKIDKKSLSDLSK
jgi:long-chain acyl-CoA synthetase